MLKKLTTFGLLFGSLLFVASAHGQAHPTATAISKLQLGGGFSYATTDYGRKANKGMTFYGDYDIGVHWGGEAEYHYTSISTPTGVSENSFLVGPRFIVGNHGFKLYGKGMIGLGRISYPPARVRETDFIFAAGGGVEYLLGDHITLRPIDFEYQRWSFQTGLTPKVVTIGAAYRF